MISRAPFAALRCIASDAAAFVLAAFALGYFALALAGAALR